MRSWRSVRMVSLLMLWIGCGGLIGGCWDYHDINHRAMPVIMGIGQGENKAYQVYLQIPIPAEQKLVIKVVSSEADTVSEAVDQIRMSIENYIDLLSVEMVVIHQSIAEQGLREALSNAIRSRNMSPKALIAITDSDMKRLLSNSKQAVNNDVTTFYKFANKRAGWTPKTAKTTMMEAFASTRSYTEDVLIPIIRPGDDTVLSFAGSAVMRQGKMVDRMNAEETLLVNVVTNRYYGAAVEVLSDTSVTIKSAHMKWRSRLNGQGAEMNGRLSIQATLTETKSDNPKSEIVKELTALLERELGQLMKKLKNSGSDPLGLGNYYRDKIPFEKLQRWRSDYYPSANITYSVKVKINNYGSLMQRE
ncbi:Ger(x)C family spore germination protein [Paenibacillus kobensis]|uniref:Ger(x)C family spore germination protein n=1 Tax=Paenibacillus kobensis TaxID=59841 RepID=UPI000FD7B76C|nr:Ger(x)C family spore germination protein [Paenibacillus kobensis]